MARYLTIFMDNTNGALDFYTFSSVDALGFEDEGLYASGLVFENTLDTFSAYSSNAYGTPVSWVFYQMSSWYIPSYGYKFKGNPTADDYAGIWASKSADNPVDVFRAYNSIIDFGSRHSRVSWLMSGMNHPHVVKMLVAGMRRELGAYKDAAFGVLPHVNKSEFKGFQVLSMLGDPDIQHQAFRDGDVIRVMLNNLSRKDQTLKLDISGKILDITRYEKDEFMVSIPYYTEPFSGDSLTMSSQSTVVLNVDVSGLSVSSSVDEKVTYSNNSMILIQEGEVKSTRIRSPVGSDKSDYVILRVGYERPASLNETRPQIILNGGKVNFWEQDSEDVYTSNSYDSFSTTLMAYIPAEVLRPINRVDLSFPDGNMGTIGAVSLRVGVPGKL
jgi:hypothetical protein